MKNDRPPFAPRTPADLEQLVRDHPLAWLVSGANEDFRASLMPVRPWRSENDRIVEFAGHLPRHCDQVDLLRQNGRAQLLFTGPHAYVSPSWMENRCQAPTWNFASARVEIDLQIDESPDLLRRILTDLVETMEQGRQRAWSLDELEARYAGLAGRIVAWTATVRHTCERYKLGQDEDPATWQDIVAGLEREGEGVLVEWMREFRKG